MPTRRTLPIAQRLLQTTFRLLSLIAPWLAVRWMYQLWFKSPRFTEPSREAAWAAVAARSTLQHPLGEMVVYQWGNTGDPIVMLVHGWSGRATQLGAFAEPLTQAGYCVIAFDAPGHGRSAGHSTTIMEISDVLNKITELYGKPQAIIAHSFGCLASLYCIAHQRLMLQQLVCISAPSSAVYLVDNFARHLCVSARVKAAFMQKVEKIFGDNLWQRISASENIQSAAFPVLIVHDQDDRDVDWQHAQWLAQSGKNTQLYITQGLGHRRILRDATVIQRIVNFIDRTPSA